MRLHGSLFSSSSSTRTLRAWAQDADNEDRLVEVELRVQGNRIIAVPVLKPTPRDIEAMPNDNAGKPEIPEERAVPLQGDDFK